MGVINVKHVTKSSTNLPQAHVFVFCSLPVDFPGPAPHSTHSRHHDHIPSIDVSSRYHPIIIPRKFHPQKKSKNSKFLMFQIFDLLRPVSDHTSTHHTRPWFHIRPAEHIRRSVSRHTSTHNSSHHSTLKYVYIWSPLALPSVLLLTAVPPTSDSTY